MYKDKKWSVDIVLKDKHTLSLLWNVLIEGYYEKGRLKCSTVLPSAGENGDVIVAHGMI